MRAFCFTRQLIILVTTPINPDMKSLAVLIIGFFRRLIGIFLSPFKRKAPEEMKPQHPILYVVAVISNPVGFLSRYRLYHEFADKIQRNPHVRLITVEHAFGEQEHKVTRSDNPLHLQLRGGPDQEIWIKEGMINAGVRHLTKIDPNWKYFAWIDADVEFTRDDWAEKTIEALQHYAVVQPWSHSIDLGPRGEPVGDDTSFAHDHFFDRPRNKKYGGSWHPGYAWAMNRTAWDSLESVGGLLSKSILGSGDHIMAWSFLGKEWMAVHGKTTDGFKNMCKDWRKACAPYIQDNIGHVDGTILHKWHGSKKRRFYVERWSVLIDNAFDPDTDITIDDHGIPTLVGNKPGLRNGIRRYFRSRDEDSTEV